ncbi:hypothetical protein KSP39_PZI012859 [Platanthera zijinensis]|uniref:Uncharacterized protein n=1 Tax=Platanthera zijinensis TaxID=2320716 RepID=A0AAP0BBX2_9ASPA
MSSALPSSQCKCKAHIKITVCHYILRRCAVTAYVPDLIFYGYPRIYMFPVNCTNAILEEWHVTSITSNLGRNLSELRVRRLYNLSRE